MTTEPARPSDVLAPRYSDGQLLGYYSADVLRELPEAGERAYLVRFLDGHEAAAFRRELRATSPAWDRIGRMAQANGRCAFCNRAVSIENDYRKVVGWERSRAAGGTNAIAVRQPRDEWACTECVEKLKRGVTVEQQTLI